MDERKVVFHHWMEGLKMFGYQFGIGLLFGAVAIVLDVLVGCDTRNIFALISGVLGTHLYSLNTERKRPGVLSKSAHKVGFANAVIQIGTALPLTLALMVMRSVSQYGTELPFDAGAILFVSAFTIVVGLPICYAIARLGIWSGVRMANDDARQYSGSAVLS